MPRLLFEKTGNAVWISHLDLMRVFQRAFRRGGILIRHSQGYSPKAHVSIALPPVSYTHLTLPTILLV